MRAIWFAAGAITAVGLMAAASVAWWTYRDFDAQEFAG